MLVFADISLPYKLKSYVLKHISFRWLQYLSCYHLVCRQLYIAGSRDSGIYRHGNFSVYCNLHQNDKWWVTFQRRVDATLDFNRTIADYKKGFGDLNGNFWLGLDKLHLLAQRGSKTTLRIKVKHSSKDQNKFFDAYYQDFSISGEDDNYRLAIGAYRGNAGDSLRFHNGRAFSTYKKTEFGELIGGWWDFGSANLNALYSAKGYGSKFMTWYDLVDDFGGITYSEMMLTQD